MKTLTVDDYQRVRLPDVEPRTKLAYEVAPNGSITLTRLVPDDKPDQVRLVKKNGYLVGVGTRKVTQAQIRKLLNEFP